jgi:sialate O-acetylesterase
MNAKEAIAAATDSKIRLLQVEKVQVPQVAADVKSPGWKVCSPQTVPGFSGVLYHFGQRLRKELDVPIGLINSSWGGSRIEPWTVTDGKGGGMYNGMIAPVTPFAIRGVTWYQGESNVKEGLKYREMMKALIEGWRKDWGYDFPFYFVQIAPFKGYGPGALPPLWEAQAASLKIPNTGMPVITDLVDKIDDIHPRNKLDVGNRLALWALAKEYKKDVTYSGPMYKSMKIDGDKVRLTFAHTNGGLKSRDDQPLTEFEVAGDDGKFVAAEATIDGDTVVVHAKDVSAPKQVHFGWRNVANPNLINKAGLPAAPFQTDNWQGGTGE